MCGAFATRRGRPQYFTVRKISFVANAAMHGSLPRWVIHVGHSAHRIFMFPLRPDSGRSTGHSLIRTGRIKHHYC
jgi:hypothetical protein